MRVFRRVIIPTPPGSGNNTAKVKVLIERWNLKNDDGKLWLTLKNHHIIDVLWYDSLHVVILDRLLLGILILMKKAAM